MKKLTFAELPVGTIFEKDGMEYRKNSNQTARLEGYGDPILCFGENEIVELRSYHEQI